MAVILLLNIIPFLLVAPLVLAGLLQKIDNDIGDFKEKYAARKRAKFKPGNIVRIISVSPNIVGYKMGDCFTIKTIRGICGRDYKKDPPSYNSEEGIYLVETDLELIV